MAHNAPCCVGEMTNCENSNSSCATVALSLSSSPFPLLPLLSPFPLLLLSPFLLLPPSLSSLPFLPFLVYSFMTSFSLSFLSLTPLALPDFPRERVPVVLAPLIYREQQDITEDRCVCTCVCVCVCVCVRACMCISVRACMCTSVPMCICAC